jgi:hypothetical protein
MHVTEGRVYDRRGPHVGQPSCKSSYICLKNQNPEAKVRYKAVAPYNNNNNNNNKR